MATTKLFFTNLRRSRLLSTLSPARYLHSPVASHTSPSSSSPPSLASPHSQLSSALNRPHLFCSRSFSTRPSDDSELAGDSFTELPTELDHIGVSESSMAALISMLDWFHDLTGLPWWMTIVSSTVAMRLTVSPILILQLKKLKRIAECFPKLPPLWPPRYSGRSYIDQFLLFRKERQAMECPTYLWFLAYFSVQVPCFVLWMSSIRRMSLDHHPGFDCGGALWFQNLTEFAHGVSGPIFPLLIAGLHFTNVQISSGASSTGKVTGLLGLLAKYYKLSLKLWALPLFFIGFCIPQGSLVYWVTNSSLTVIQHLLLKHPAVRTKLGLPEKVAPGATSVPDNVGIEFMTFVGSGNQQGKVSVHNLSPEKLLALSLGFLSKGDTERATPLLQLSIKKYPEYVRPLIVMGKTLVHKGMLAEAAEYLEHAISKLYFFGPPTKTEDVNLFIVASQWAAIVYTKQGKWAEGIAHLERIANMKELAEEPESKSLYFDVLVLLSSALVNQGRKEEAVEYMRLAAAYNPAYKHQLEELEKEDDFVSDVTSSHK